MTDTRVAQLESENRRLRAAAEQMQAEIATLTTLLEPMHALTEHLEQQRRKTVTEQHTLRSEMRRTEAKRQAEWQRREGEMLGALNRRDKELQALLQRHAQQAHDAAAAQDRLRAEQVQAVQARVVGVVDHSARVAELEQRLLGLYASTSWTVTKPLRYASRLVQGLRR